VIAIDEFAVAIRLGVIGPDKLAVAAALRLV